MCGRYAAARSVDDIAAAFGICDADVAAVPAPDWNVAPTVEVPVVRAADGRRVLEAMRWGLVPSWASGPAVGVRMINARVETVRERPAFRDAVLHRRCLLPADGWYEWARAAGPVDARQPYYLAPPSGEMLAFAGIWANWDDGDHAPVRTVAILTGPAPADLQHLHHRAPVVLPPQQWAGWLDVVTPPDPYLRATGCGVVTARPVSPRVGDVRAAGRQLTEAVVPPEQQPLF